MFNKNRLVFLVLGGLLSTGCTHTVTLKTDIPDMMTAQAGPQNSSIIPQPSFHTHSLFSDYTDAIATQLVAQSTQDLKTLPLIITSFGYQARTLEDNHQLSYQLSESIAHDLQPFGVKTISAYQHQAFTYLDATGLQINASGKEAMRAMNSNHALTGIIRPNERGVMVHAKIVEVSSMQVISTAEKFIPYYAFTK